jgi:putative phosphoesterase
MCHFYNYRPGKEISFMEVKKRHLLAPVVMISLGSAAAVTGFLAVRWIHLYIRWFPGLLFWLIWVIPPMAFAVASSLPRGKAKSWCRRIGEGWFGLALYPLIFASLGVALAIICRIFGGKLPLAPTGWVILLLSAALYPLGMPRATKPRLTRYRIRVNKLKEPLRIALISDLHLGFFTPEYTPGRIRDMVNSLKPDMVLVAGDTFDEEFSALKNPEAAAEALVRMESTYGTFACDGNHDRLAPGPEMEEFFQKAKFRMLRDEVLPMDMVTLVGRLDYRGHRTDIKTLLKDAPTDKPILVLDHNPRQSRDVLNAGASVVLSGHTHIKLDEERSGIRCLNPGSVSIPKDGSHSCLICEDGKFRFYIWEDLS